MKKSKPVRTKPLELPVDRAPDRQEVTARLKHLIRFGELSLAYQIITSLMEKESDCAELMDLLGTVYLRAGALDSANGLIRQALHLNPGCVDAHFHLAQVLAEQGKLLEALEHAMLAQQSQPNCSIYQELLAKLESEMEKRVEISGTHRYSTIVLH